MEKLRDVKIETRQVYLNIIHGNGDVDTELTTARKAVKKYGDLDVKQQLEPEDGLTAIILKAEE